MLGDHEGQGDLFLGTHSIHASAVAREKNSQLIQRRVTTVDELVYSKKVPVPHVIKLDIEGGEYAALCGAGKTIREFKPHLVFESDDNMKRFGYSRKDLLALLDTLGPYDFYYVSELGQLAPVTKSNLHADYSDILARADVRRPAT
jgi:hypothetical protein